MRATDVSARPGVGEQQVVVPAATASVAQHPAKDIREDHLPPFVAFRGVLDDPVTDLGGAATDPETMTPQIHVADTQPGHLTPSYPAQSEREHHRPPPPGFVGQPHQLIQTQIPMLLSPFPGLLHPLAWIRGDETVILGLLHNPREYAARPQYHGRAHRLGHDLASRVSPALMQDGHPFLHLAARDGCQFATSPHGLHSASPLALQRLDVTRLASDTFRGDPCRPERFHSGLPRLRVDIAPRGLRQRDVFRRPVLRVGFAFEATFVGLRAVGLPVSDAVARLASAGLVSGDVRHFYYLLNNGRFTF